MCLMFKDILDSTKIMGGSVIKLNPSEATGNEHIWDKICVTQYISRLNCFFFPFSYVNGSIRLSQNQIQQKFIPFSNSAERNRTDIHQKILWISPCRHKSVIVGSAQW